MFHIIKPNLKINFVGHWKFWLSLSGVAILGVLVLFFVKGLNYGIDFTGGAEVKVQVPAAWTTDSIRGILTKQGLDAAKIITIGEPSDHEFLIRVQQESQDITTVASTITRALESAAPSKAEVVVKSADVVGPSAGGVLRANGLLAAFYALLSILIYVAIRFDFRFAPGAVLALFHDSVLVLGVFMIFGVEFDLTVLAALLALIGYSNNDTIIVYDRVREQTKLNPSLSIEEVVNLSINQTLGRTLMTSLLTMITVVALYFFGGAVLKPFALTYIIGIVVGTYSSIFIASSVVIALTHRQEKKRRMGHKKKRREVKLAPEAHLGM
jgi:preprotein translocase subunit SecF